MFPIETRILLVDDSQMARNLLRKSLSELGFSDFVEAGDGQEAIELLMNTEISGRPFGLVISDCKMPITDGLQLLNFVRKSSPNPSLPFVLITAEGDEGTVLDAIRGGADAYLLKPFSQSILRDRLSKVWNVKKARSEASGP